MLYAFGFEKVAVVVSDLYFVDPNPGNNQEGPERGVRLEVRMLDRGELHGSIYSAQPIGVAEPIWRGDLLERVDGPYGAFDRTHHHPKFTGWEPSERNFVTDLSVDPVGWVGMYLGDLDGLLAKAGLSPDDVAPGDAEALRQAVPEIQAAIRKLLDRIWAGELGRAPDSEEQLVSARVGWL